MELEPNGKIILFILFILLGMAFLFAAVPYYNVWQQSMAGQAQLAHAKYSKEVAVAEARAKMEAAELLAEAEIRRARGVAQANEIIGQSLKGNEQYLRYLWIQGLEKTSDREIIYVPTEANLPILEAGRLRK